MCVCLSVCPSVSLRFCRSVMFSQSRSMNCMCTGVFACTNQSLFRLFVSAKGLSDAGVHIHRLILDNCKYCYDDFVVVFMRVFFFMGSWPAISRKGKNTILCILFCSFALCTPRWRRHGIPAQLPVWQQLVEIPDDVALARLGLGPAL